jgi:hypothetical protein
MVSELDRVAKLSHFLHIFLSYVLHMYPADLDARFEPPFSHLLSYMRSNSLGRHLLSESNLINRSFSRFRWESLITVQALLAGTVDQCSLPPIRVLTQFALSQMSDEFFLEIHVLGGNLGKIVEVEAISI